MFRSYNIIVKDNPSLLKMMEGSLAIYDQALYYQRQEYFRGLKNKEKYRLLQCNELWNIVKNTQAYKEAKLDCGSKVYVIKQMLQNWKIYMRKNRKFFTDNSAYSGKPNAPRYLHDRRTYFTVLIDSSRLTRKGCTNDREFCIPNSDYIVRIPEGIRRSDIRSVRISKFYDRTKISIIYEDLNVSNAELDYNSVMGIDMGVNNLCAITINDKNISYIVKGGVLKSINQYYIKKEARLISLHEKCKNHTANSKAILSLRRNRECRVYGYINSVANRIIDLCIENKVGRIVIGHNNGWKSGVTMGKINNQNFMFSPISRLINTLVCKAEKYSNLRVDIVEESYTSKCDHLAGESMEKHSEYSGKRVTRGCFISSVGKIINADINGAIGILRKVNAVSDEQIMFLRDRGDIVSPKVLLCNS